MYGKLFVSMYDGTLATRGPWEALVTFQQFLILADRSGVVDMTPDAISRRTTIPIEIIERGISELEREDDGSRTPDENGRRILRISDTRTWGWQVVNYEKYRQIRTADERREYMKQYQRARRAGEIKPKKRVVGAYPSAFEVFWAAYPRHEAKGTAAKAWDRLAPDEALQGRILAAIVTQRAAAGWRRDNGKFIPHAATWLNARRWDDETRNGAVSDLLPNGEKRTVV